MNRIKINKELQNIKKNQTNLRNIIIEIRNTFQGLYDPLVDQMIQRNRSGHSKRPMEITQVEQKKGKQIFQMKIA